MLNHIYSNRKTRPQSSEAHTQPSLQFETSFLTNKHSFQTTQQPPSQRSHYSQTQKKTANSRYEVFLDKVERVLDQNFAIAETRVGSLKEQLQEQGQDNKTRVEGFKKTFLERVKELLAAKASKLRETKSGRLGIDEINQLVQCVKVANDKLLDFNRRNHVNFADVAKRQHVAYGKKLEMLKYLRSVVGDKEQELADLESTNKGKKKAV